MSSVSSCTTTTEEQEDEEGDENEIDSDDDELVDKDLRKIQRKSIFGFQVRDKKKNRESSKKEDGDSD